MIVDSSALVAILRLEPDASEIGQVVDRAARLRISSATLLETSTVVGPTRFQDLDTFLDEVGVEVVPFDATHAKAAREAFVRFGRGSGSPARLNFGDCMTYALAKVTGEPLLFKGDDFTHTDITPVL